MVLKILAMLISLTPILLVGWGIGIGETDTWTVCAQGCNFTSIQAAIDAASPEDIVIVNPETAVVFGHYVENIVIDKPITLEGQGNGWPPHITAKDDDQPVILVRSQVRRVIIRGFEISGGEVGISVKDDAQVTIQSNSITENVVGVLIGAAQASIQDNFIFQNGRTGFGGGGIRIGWFEGGKEAAVDIVHNAIIDNGGPGGGVGIDAFMPGETASLIILDNLINRTTRGDGIWILTVGEVRISGNTIVGSKEGNGAVIISAGRISIHNNTIAGNEWNGLAIWGRESTIIENTIVGNERAGIALGDVPDIDLFAKGKFTIVRNQVRLNVGGIIIGSVDDCFMGQIPVEAYDRLEIRGEDNTVEGNYKGDLCPADYPWPPGFVKRS